MMRLIILPPLILGACCARNIQSPTDAAPGMVPCIPIYGRATDWDIISDDLARNIYRHNLMCTEINR